MYGLMEYLPELLRLSSLSGNHRTLGLSRTFGTPHFATPCFRIYLPI